MLIDLKRVNRSVLQSDIGIVVALVVTLGWLSHRLLTHHEIELPTAVTLLGFLLLFIIERDHAREMKAIQLKLDELLAAQPGASNRLIRAEEASENVLHLAHEALHDIALTKAAHEAVSIEHSNFFKENDITAP